MRMFLAGLLVGIALGTFLLTAVLALLSPRVHIHDKETTLNKWWWDD